MKMKSFREFVRVGWSFLDVMTTVALLVLTTTLIWPSLTRAWTRQPTVPANPEPSVSKSREPPLPSEPIPLGTTGLKGNPSAVVAILEYSDFECPFCGRFTRDVLPALEKNYVVPGLVRLAFRHMPLESIHHSALDAAQSAECAGRQGRFWEMHDFLFAKSDNLAASNYENQARLLALDNQEFKACFGTQTIEMVRNQATEARALGVRSTPTFFVGLVSDNLVTVTHRLSGAKPLSAFVDVLDELLDKSKQTRELVKEK